MEDAKRWWFVPWYVKVYRWVRYVPIYFAWGCCWAVWFMLFGKHTGLDWAGRPASKLTVALWGVKVMLRKADCQYLGRYYLLSEMIADIRKRHAEEPPDA